MYMPQNYELDFLKISVRSVLSCDRLLKYHFASSSDVATAPATPAMQYAWGQCATGIRIENSDRTGLGSF